MKQLITEKQCVLCRHLKTNILRGDNDVHGMNDRDAQIVVLNMMKRAFEFD